MVYSYFTFVVSILYSLLMNRTSLHKNNYFPLCKEELHTVSENINYTTNVRVRQQLRASIHFE